MQVKRKLPGCAAQNSSSSSFKSTLGAVSRVAARADSSFWAVDQYSSSSAAVV
ncbi:MAG: hypothetical protein ACLUOB_00105 [Subdoligranulum sp.]